MANFIPAKSFTAARDSVEHHQQHRQAGKRQKGQEKETGRESEKKDVLKMSKCEHNFTQVSVAKSESSVG
jgi:hypothetical protein